MVKSYWVLISPLFLQTSKINGKNYKHHVRSIKITSKQEGGLSNITIPNAITKLQKRVIQEESVVLKSKKIKL